MIGGMRHRRKGRGKSGANKKNWLQWKMRYADGFRRHSRSGKKSLPS